MIYTSYFGNMRNIPKDNYVCVAISASVPEGVNCLHFKKLAPKYDNFKDLKDGKQSFTEFAGRYESETLSNLRPIDVVSEIKQLAGKDAEGKNIVLLCYEKNSMECHRSLVAQWLTNGGTYVNELKL